MERFETLIKALGAAFDVAADAMLVAVLAFLGGRQALEDAMAAVDEVRVALEEDAREWVEDTLPEVYLEGMRVAMSSTNTPDVDPGALDQGVHDEALEVFIDELYSQVAAATNNISEEAKRQIRDIARRTLAASLDSGTRGKDQARDMDRELRERGIKFVDKGGRLWQPRHYAEMVLRTQTIEVANEANLNTTAEIGSPGVYVSDGGPGDVDQPCKDANGMVWTLAYAREHKTEHPNCRRAFAPLPSTYKGPYHDGQEHLEPEPPEPSPPEPQRRPEPPAPEPESEPEPEPESATDLVAAGTPVRNALSLNRGFSGRLMGDTLDAIEEVHHDGELPEIVVKTSSGKNRSGSYRYEALSGKSQDIMLSSHSADYLTAAHEVGHFLDHKGLGDADSFVTEKPHSPEMERLLETLEASEEVQTLHDMYEHAGNYSVEFQRGNRTYRDRVQHTYTRYLYSSVELFARAYAQYIAVRSGNENMLRDVESSRRPDQEGVYYPRQWTSDSFEPIAAAFDELFRAEGWRA